MLLDAVACYQHKVVHGYPTWCSGDIVRVGSVPTLPTHGLQLHCLAAIHPQLGISLQINKARPLSTVIIESAFPAARETSPYWSEDVVHACILPESHLIDACARAYQDSVQKYITPWLMLLFSSGSMRDPLRRMKI